ncbi:MAG: hypothetical protein A2X22_04725 [Bacteroidetes bacterium GWF2_49_14]|nr:MAG: hypothetical protein A2X22_04725 [Bacteroidetes bacterium GWF2_49_14]
MNYLGNPHTFHIPVMGIGYSIDTAVRVAPYGISSVISLVDDILIEKMREFYSRQHNIPFEPITRRIKDFRAKRITSYLNLVDQIVREKFEEIKRSAIEKKEEFNKYIEMLPDFSTIKREFNELIASKPTAAEVKRWVQKKLRPGSIDVNIMTKLDKENYYQGETLPQEYNDAHAALRGFAESNLDSSIVLSAGMNPRLYAYLENFDDFYPDAKGYIKKRITLKVSDYRSAIIQGKFLAKKGIWVSEYRVESGLNCGGHAFATDGFLLGPILEAFRSSKQELGKEVYELWIQALKTKNRPVPSTAPEIRITAQGGVGTAEEHEFLIDYYDLDSVGWGSPFLLVPEAVAMDDETREQLCSAGEDEVYLSGISPLGVPFYSMKGNSKDAEKEERIRQGEPGSPCPKRYACLDTEFTEKPICTASREYQQLKINQLDEETVTQEEYQQRYDNIVEKSCICVGLGTPSLLANDLNHRAEGPGVSVCPGPNLAYFDHTVSLPEMVGHIYGRNNVIERTDRPHVFIKELNIYIDYLKNRLAPKLNPANPKEKKTLDAFRENIREGIRYYKELFSGKITKLQGRSEEILRELAKKEAELS